MGCNLMHLISKPGYLYFSMPEVVLLPGKRKGRVYQSQTSLYVLNKQSQGTTTLSDLQSSTQLTQDYMILVKSREFYKTNPKGRVRLD